MTYLTENAKQKLSSSQFEMTSPGLERQGVEMMLIVLI